MILNYMIKKVGIWMSAIILSILLFAFIFGLFITMQYAEYAFYSRIILCFFVMMIPAFIGIRLLVINYVYKIVSHKKIALSCLLFCTSILSVSVFFNILKDHWTHTHMAQELFLSLLIYNHNNDASLKYLYSKPAGTIIDENIFDDLEKDENNIKYLEKQFNDFRMLMDSRSYSQISQYLMNFCCTGFFVSSTLKRI